MFSHADLKRIFEKAFVPTLCECSISIDGIMSLELIDPESQATEMVMAGIRIADLQNARALVRLVREVKREADLRKQCRENETTRVG